MYLDIFVFITFYFLTIFSTIGYGFALQKITGLNKYSLNIGFIGLSGILFLIIYSYISHFFLAHGLLHNIIINFFGLILFLIYFRFWKKEILLLILIFSILIISFFIFKTHDDFPYYHFPYTNYLNESSVIFGLGNLNLGFRTPSSIFFLNSLFFLPVIKFYAFQIGAILFFGFSILILFDDIKTDLKLDKIDLTLFLRLFSLCFILIFFYRIQEHGTDRSAQILVLLFIIELFSIRKNYDNFNNHISKIIILLTLMVGLKLFFLLYFIFIIPFIYYLVKDKKLKMFNKIFFNKLFFLSLISIALYVSIYFINTGCFFYPVTFSCIENLSWSIEIDQVQRLRIHYENWAKAGSGAGYENIDQVNYIKNLNWLPTWIEKYFFNKVSDFILGIILLILVISLFFIRESKPNFRSNFNSKFYYLFILILFFEWFFNHPALRYGGYSLIALIFFIPTSYLISKYCSFKNVTHKVTIIVLLSILIFSSRNIVRLNNEIKIYEYEPIKNPYYYLDDDHFRVQNQIMSLIKNYKLCQASSENCDLVNEPKKIISKFGKYIIIKNDK